MSNQQHTPGPWEILKGDHGRTIYSIGPLSSDEYAGTSWLEVSEPDAHLIAAAPELLEALESVLVNCLDSEGLAAAYTKARAAIAKAKGEKA